MVARAMRNVRRTGLNLLTNGSHIVVATVAVVTAVDEVDGKIGTAIASNKRAVNGVPQHAQEIVVLAVLGDTKTVIHDCITRLAVL